MPTRTVRSPPSDLLAQLLLEETGQDVVEYVLLAGFIGVVGIALWGGITSGIDSAYQNWDSGTQNLWDPPDPVP